MGSKARARTVYKERCGECGAKYQDRSPLGLLAKRRAHQAWHDEVDAAPESNPTGIGHRGVDFPRAPRPGDPPWIDELDVMVGRKG